MKTVRRLLFRPARHLLEMGLRDLEGRAAATAAHMMFDIGAVVSADEIACAKRLGELWIAGACTVIEIADEAGDLGHHDGEHPVAPAARATPHQHVADDADHRFA